MYWREGNWPEDREAIALEGSFFHGIIRGSMAQGGDFHKRDGNNFFHGCPICLFVCNFTRLPWLLLRPKLWICLLRGNLLRFFFIFYLFLSLVSVMCISLVKMDNATNCYRLMAIICDYVHILDLFTY